MKHGQIGIDALDDHVSDVFTGASLGSDLLHDLRRAAAGTDNFNFGKRLLKHTGVDNRPPLTEVEGKLPFLLGCLDDFFPFAFVLRLSARRIPCVTQAPKRYS